MSISTSNSPTTEPNKPVRKIAGWLIVVFFVASIPTWIICVAFKFNGWIVIFEVTYSVLNGIAALTQIPAINRLLMEAFTPRNPSTRVSKTTIRLPQLGLANTIRQIRKRAITLLAFIAIVVFGVWNLVICFFYNLDTLTIVISLILGCIVLLWTFFRVRSLRERLIYHPTLRRYLQSFLSSHSAASLLKRFRLESFLSFAARLQLSTIFFIFLLVTSGIWNIYLNRVADACNGVASSGISTQGIGATVRGRECIGISDGSAPFDTNRSDGPDKLKAAQALLDGNLSAASSNLRDAILTDPTDAEARIYLEDLRIRENRHITIVVDTILSGIYIADGRDVVQGAYVAQKENNDRCSSNPNCLAINLLIANIGSGQVDEADYANSVAEQIWQTAHSNSTIVGVMDGLSSQSAININNTFFSHIPNILPMVAAKASSTFLSRKVFFFRVVPSDYFEASFAASYAENTLHAKRVAILFREENDYSADLLNSFLSVFPSQNIVDTGEYQERNNDSVQTALKQVLSKNPDLIYCSCYASEVSTVLEHLPTSGPLAKLRVLGGDAFYETGDYSQKARPDLNRLLFTAQFYPGAPKVESTSSFFTDERVYFQNTAPTSGVATSYDALLTIGVASTRAFIDQGQPITPANLDAALLKINPKEAVQGVTGQISFEAQGSDPVNKSLFLLTFDKNGQVQYVAECGQFLATSDNAIPCAPSS